MFDNLRISVRIALALGITLAGLLAVAVMAYSGLSSEYHTIKHIIGEDFELAEQIGNVRGAVGNLRRYEKDMLLNMDKLDKVGDYRKKWDGAHAKALESLANLARTSKDDKEKADFARLQEKVASYAKGFAPLAGTLQAGQYKTLGEANHAMEAIKGPVREMEGLLDEISGKLAEDSANTEKTVDAQYAAVLRSLAITTLLIFAVTLGLSLAIVRSITQPLRLLREAAQRSATNHDLTVAMPDCGRNELGETIAALRSMNDATRALIAEANRAAGEASRLSGEMAHAAMNVSSASDQQAQATASSAAAIEQFTVSIGVVADNAKLVHEDSEHSNAAAAEGAGTARRAGEEIGQIATSLADAGDVMASLSRRSEEIGGIVSVIKDIADQTNLLALNAAIEAARAGETGRGFAVVADEVRKLAERTTQATSEISGMIQNVQADTQSANQAMQSAHGRIEAGVATTLSLVDALGRIQDTSQKVVGTMTEVSDALREQSAASTEIARNVEHITQMSDENSAAASAARQAAESLSEVAHQLESAIGRFRI